MDVSQFLDLEPVFTKEDIVTNHFLLLEIRKLDLVLVLISCCLDQTSCDQIRYSEAYNEDPCCSKNAAFYECCHPYTREIDLQVRAYPENDEKYEENCEFAECVQADVFHATQLIDLQQTEQGNLCTLRWYVSQTFPPSLTIPPGANSVLIPHLRYRTEYLM